MPQPQPCPITFADTLYPLASSPEAFLPLPLDEGEQYSQASTAYNDDSCSISTLSLSPMINTPPPSLPQALVKVINEIRNYLATHPNLAEQVKEMLETIVEEIEADPTLEKLKKYLAEEEGVLDPQAIHYQKNVYMSRRTLEDDLMLQLIIHIYDKAELPLFKQLLESESLIAFWAQWLSGGYAIRDYHIRQRLLNDNVSPFQQVCRAYATEHLAFTEYFLKKLEEIKSLYSQRELGETLSALTSLCDPYHPHLTLLEILGYWRFRQGNVKEAEKHIGSCMVIKRVKFDRKSKTNHVTYFQDILIQQQKVEGSAFISTGHPRPSLHGENLDLLDQHYLNLFERLITEYQDRFTAGTLLSQRLGDLAGVEYSMSRHLAQRPDFTLDNFAAVAHTVFAHQAAIMELLSEWKIPAHISFAFYTYLIAMWCQQFYFVPEIQDTELKPQIAETTLRLFLLAQAHLKQAEEAQVTITPLDKISIFNAYQNRISLHQTSAPDRFIQPEQLEDTEEQERLLFSSPTCYGGATFVISTGLFANSLKEWERQVIEWEDLKATERYQSFKTTSPF